MKVFAKDVMENNVTTVAPDMLLPDLERRFVDCRVSGFPVVDTDQTILGVVSIKDVLAHLCQERGIVELSTAFYDAETLDYASVSDDWVSSEVGKRADHHCVRDLMNTDIIAVSPDCSLHDVAAVMHEQGVHRVLVIHQKQLVGIISTSDVVRACGNEGIDISFTPPKVLDF